MSSPQQCAPATHHLVLHILSLGSTALVGQILIVVSFGCDRVEFPPDKVNALQTNEHIHVEQDGDVKTQG